MSSTRRRVAIAPSILSADFGRLTDEVRTVEAGGADAIHIDVMDGRFVPNITLGIPVVKAIRKATALPLDLHLMIVEPEKYLDQFIDAGADIINIHVEATAHTQRALSHIRGRHKKAGLALNPATTEDCLRYVLGSLDQVLVMTVNPGFGGQSFLHDVLPKIREIRRMIDAGKHPIDIEIDGGVAVGTAGLCAAAGACALVAGNAVFTEPDYGVAIAAIRREAEGALPAA